MLLFSLYCNRNVPQLVKCEPRSSYGHKKKALKNPKIQISDFSTQKS